MCGEEKDEQLVLQIFAQFQSQQKNPLSKFNRNENENQRNKLKYF